MGFPQEQKLKEIRSPLDKKEPSFTLPKNATAEERLKYKICQRFVAHVLDHEKSQVELAKKLNIDTAQINDIVKYRIDLFTLDKLIEFEEVLDASSQN